MCKKDIGLEITNLSRGFWRRGFYVKRRNTGTLDNVKVMYKFKIALSIFTKGTAILYPVTIIYVVYAVFYWAFGVMNMTTNHTV